MAERSRSSKSLKPFTSEDRKMTTLPNVSIFDWNGELYQQIADDEVTFSIKLSKIEGSECMGFTSFTIAGSPEAIEDFLSYYELELNEEV
jgi:hypothetical protein